MKTMKKIAFATLAVSIALSGCATRKNQSEVVVAPMAGSSYTTTTGVKNTTGMNSSALQAQAATLANVVYFTYDSSSLNQADTALLDQHIALLTQNSGATITLTGHTDERGSREYNLALGERRAQTVQSYLVAHGVNANNIQVVSYGEERPAVAGSTEAAWAKNRRVELTY